MLTINELIDTRKIYEGFDTSAYPSDLQGWGGHREFFEKMVRYTEPRLAIEVGSWKGRSAVTMGKLLEEYASPGSKLLCVDTWLGATEFVDKDDDDPKRGLRRVNGYPTIYYQFLANVVLNNLSQKIVPFPQSSVNAARYLKKNKIQADLIYIDGSHEYEDVKQDLEHYYELLSPRGLICGDDYCSYWSGVIQAVGEFSLDRCLVLQTKRYENGPGEAPSDYWVLSQNGIPL